MPQPPIPPSGSIRQQRVAERRPEPARSEPLQRPLQVHWREIQWIGFETDPDEPKPAERTAPAAAMPRIPQEMPAAADFAAVDEPGAADPGAADPGRGEFAAAEAAPEPAVAPGFAPGAADDPELELDIAPMAGTAGTPSKPMPRAGAMVMVGAIVGQQQRRPAGLAKRRLRLAAAAASVGALAVFAYQGGDRLAGLAGATTGPAAAPAWHEAALATPPGEPATRSSDPASDPASDRASNPPSDPVERAGYFLERAKAGDPAAQYNLAVLYGRGDGLVQDFASAASWFREAAISGNAAAQFNLGVLHERGLGVQQNMAEAISWYRSAADRDYLAAQYNLGLAYAEGRGSPRDPVAAARWYHRAAEQGLVPAMINFAILYEKGEGVERSLGDAYAWYRAAAQRGDAAAEKRAGELLQQFTEPQGRQAASLAAAIAASIRAPSPGLPSSSAAAAAAAVPARLPAPVLKSGSWIGNAAPVSPQRTGHPPG